MIAHYNGINVDELYLCDLQIHRSMDLHFSQRPDATLIPDRARPK